MWKESVIILFFINIGLVVGLPVSHTEVQGRHGAIPSTSSTRVADTFHTPASPSLTHHHHHDQAKLDKADVEEWADSLLLDEPSSTPRHTHPNTIFNRQQADIPISTFSIDHAGQVSTLSESEANRLKWIESILDDDSDYDSPHHATAPSITTAASSSNLHTALTAAAKDILTKNGKMPNGIQMRNNAHTLQYVSSIDQPADLHQPTMHSSPAQVGSTSSSRSSQSVSAPYQDEDGRLKRIYRPYWTKEYPERYQQHNLRRGADQMAIAKYGGTSPKLRHFIMKGLTHTQMSHLAEGKSVNTLPSPNPLASVRKSASKEKKRKKVWNAGFKTADRNTILAFGDMAMRIRGARSRSARNNFLSSLSREELIAIAKNRGEEKNVILTKLLAPQRDAE